MNITENEQVHGHVLRCDHGRITKWTIRVPGPESVQRRLTFVVTINGVNQITTKGHETIMKKHEITTKTPQRR